MKKKIILTIVVFIAIFTIWAMLNRERFTQGVVDLGMALTSSVKHRNPSSEKAKFEVSTEMFSKEFKDDASAANKKYINQVVLLSGEVVNITGVTLSFTNIACNIDSSDLVKLKEIKVGAKIKLQGLVVGYNDLMEEVSLAQCTIK